MESLRIPKPKRLLERQGQQTVKERTADHFCPGSEARQKVKVAQTHQESDMHGRGLSLSSILRPIYKL
jgi:hypothetical protein